MRRFFTSLKFLTVFPVPPRWDGGEEDMSHCLPFFPLVGILIGGLAAGWTWGLDYFLPPWPTSVLAAVALVGISRALHMDGLSDTADGFLSSRPRDRILEIMRDSHVGPMGVVAIVCVLCLKIGALALTCFGIVDTPRSSIFYRYRRCVYEWSRNFTSEKAV